MRDTSERFGVRRRRLGYEVLSALALGSILVGCLADEPAAPPSLSSALLLPTPITELRVEIRHVVGAEPGDLALRAFADVLHQHVEKAEIRIGRPEAFTDRQYNPARVWTPSSVRQLHDAEFGDHAAVSSDTAFLTVTYLDGEYRSSQGDAVGLASGHDIFIFPDVIRNTGSIEPPASARVERSVLIHELGHVFGLVDCGVPMVRPHGTTGCHSTNSRSVMYANPDIGFANGLLDLAQEGKWVDYEFDENDLADIAAFKAAASSR